MMCIDKHSNREEVKTYMQRKMMKVRGHSEGPPATLSGEVDQMAEVFKARSISF